MRRGNTPVLQLECGKLLCQSHHVIYFCAKHNGKIDTDEKLICSTFTLADLCELRTAWGLLSGQNGIISIQCLNGIISMKKSQNLIGKANKVVHTRILF